MKVKELSLRLLGCDQESEVYLESDTQGGQALKGVEVSTAQRAYDKCGILTPDTKDKIVLLTPFHHEPDTNTNATTNA